MAVLQPDDHKIGIAGRYSLPEEALHTAKACGLHIAMQEGGGYKISMGTEGPAPDLSKFLPALSANQKTHTLSDIKTVLGFMHQPIKYGIGDDLDARMKTHRVLRFLTTGVAEIDSADNDEQAECHAAAIESMKNSDAWRSDREVTIEGEDTTFVTIPGLRPELEKGLVLKVSSTKEPAAPKHEALLQRVSVYLPPRENDEIIFDSGTFSEFCQNVAADSEIDYLLSAVRQERMSLQARANIQGRTKRFEESGYNQILGLPETYPLSENVRALSGCTSALTPLIKSNEVKESWKSYCPTQAKKTPFDHIAMELDVLSAQLQDLGLAEEISPAQWQATLSEFSSLLCFSREAAKVLDLNSEHKTLLQDEFMRSAVAPQMMENHHREALKILKKAMDKNGSPFGDMMKSFGKSLMTVIDDTVSYVTETRKRAVIVGSLTALYVTGQMAATDPNVQQWGSEKIAAASEFITGPKKEEPKEEEIFFFGEDGLQSAQVEVEEKYRVAEDLQIQNATGQEAGNAIVADTPAMCQVTHYHLRGTQLIPQCFFNDKIKDFSNGVIDYTDGFSDEVSVRSGVSEMPESAASAFSNRARQAVSPTANFWFYLNILQFMAHVPFFFSMGSRGIKQGPRALKEVGLLFGEFADSSVTMMKQRPLAIPMVLGGVAVGLATDLSLAGTVLSGIGGGLAGNYTWHRKSPLQRRLLELGENGKSDEAPRNVINTMTFTESEGPPFEFTQPVNLNLNIAGVSQRFTLEKQEFKALHTALIYYGQLIQNAAHSLSLESSWEQRLIAQDVNKAIKAMEAFKSHGDVLKLQLALNQTIPDIAGTQMRTQNYSSLFKALNADERASSGYKRLGRHGNILHGQRIRAEKMENLDRRLRLERTLPLDEKFIVKARYNLTSVWDDTVKGMRGLQSVYSKIPAKKSLAAGYGLVVTGAIACDMTGNSQSLGESFAQISDAVSGLHGQMYGTGLTTAAFGGYNIYDDIILNDVAGGGTFLAFGIAGGYYGYKKLAKPLLEGLKDHKARKTLPEFEAA